MESNFRFGIIERLTVAAFIAGIAGVAASMSLPAPYQEFLARTGVGPVLFWASIAVIIASVLFFLCDLILHICKKMGVRHGMALAAIGTVLIMIGGIIGLIGAFRINIQNIGADGAAVDSLPNLRRLFDTDFDNTLRHSRDVTVASINQATKQQLYSVVIRRTAYEDFPSKGLFTGFYIPKSDFTFDIGMYLAGEAKSMLQESLNEVKVEMKIPGDSAKTSLSDLTFTGRVYLYHESDLTLRQSADLEEAFSQNGMKIQLRGWDYAVARRNDEKQKSSAKRN